MSREINRAELSAEELAKIEEQEFQTGPFSVLTAAVKTNCQVLINCRNNKKLLARIRAFDRHSNLVLENIQELWTEMPKKNKGQKTGRPINKNRGDSVITVVQNPAGLSAN